MRAEADVEVPVSEAEDVEEVYDEESFASETFESYSEEEEEKEAEGEVEEEEIETEDDD